MGGGGGRLKGNRTEEASQALLPQEWNDKIKIKKMPYL